MWDYLDAYEQAWPNLVVHDPAYPTPDYLRSVTCIGNVRTTSCMDEDTAGSELIRQRILADDPRPLYLLAGGTPTPSPGRCAASRRTTPAPAHGARRLDEAAPSGQSAADRALPHLE